MSEWTKGYLIGFIMGMSGHVLVYLIQHVRMEWVP